MKSILSALLVLACLPAIAAEWQRYHHDPAQALELFLDLDSLRQNDDSFEADIRLSIGDGRQSFIGWQMVNCSANTYRLGKLREIGSDRAAADKGEAESGPISADSATSLLKEMFCARWQEPKGVRWKAFAVSPQERFFHDLRVERLRPPQGYGEDFRVWLKSVGSNKELLSEVSISCRENSFALISGVHRDKARGWVANIAAGKAQTPAPDSSIATLRTKLCRPATAR